MKWGPLSDDKSHDDDKCVKCKTGFLLINNKCVDHFKSISENCGQINEDLEDGLRTSVEC
ncbi:MAG: hypothetical protein DHS20C09_15610 [marine bacterium B5-7]|nr:MAG: hypothetical protein DHS20C09_15610 [marine bacterium B5-7]